MVILRVIFIVLFINSSVNIFGQGVLLEKGQSGIGISGGLTIYKYVTGFGGNCNYSFSGVFDLEIAIERSKLGKNLSELTGLTLFPNITYYIIKQNKQIPVSFAIGAGYQWSTFKTSYNDKITGEFLILGAALMKQFKLSESSKLIPLLAGNYYFGKLTRAEYQDIEAISAVYTLTLALVNDLSGKISVSINPAIGLNDSEIIYGLGFTFIFKI